MAQKSCLFVQNYSRFGDWVDEFVAGIIEMRFLQGTPCGHFLFSTPMVMALAHQILHRLNALVGIFCFPLRVLAAFGPGGAGAGSQCPSGHFLFSTE